MDSFCNKLTLQLKVERKEDTSKFLMRTSGYLNVIWNTDMFDMAFQTDGDYLCSAFVGWDWHVFKMFWVLEIIALIILKHSFPSVLSRNNITILQTLF